MYLKDTTFQSISNIRMIALDLDGTALNSAGELSCKTQQVLKQISDAGIVIAAATGRAFGALPYDLFQSKTFSYAITSNGTGIYRLSDKKRIYSKLMSQQNLSDLLELLSQYSYPMEVFIDGTAYADSRYVANPLAFQVSERSAAYVKATRTPIDDIPAFVLANRDRVEGMDIIVTDMTLKKVIREQASRIPNLYITSSVSHYVEFASKGATKETALAYLANQCSIPPEQIMAFGDGENDLEMLSFSGIGVAMGNACALLKEAADYITGTNAHVR